MPRKRKQTSPDDVATTQSDKGEEEPPTDETEKTGLSPKALQTIVGKVKSLGSLPTKGQPLKVHIVDKETLRSIAANPSIKILQKFKPGTPKEKEDIEQNSKDDSQPSTSKASDHDASKLSLNISKPRPVHVVPSLSPKGGWQGPRTVTVPESPSTKGVLEPAKSPVVRFQSPAKTDTSVERHQKDVKTKDHEAPKHKYPKLGWTEEILDRATSLLISGRTYPETAEELNISVHGLRQKIRPVVYEKAMAETKDSEDQELEAFQLIKAETHIKKPKRKADNTQPAQPARDEEGTEMDISHDDDGSQSQDMSDLKAGGSSEATIKYPRILRAKNPVPGQWTEELTDRAIRLLVSGKSYHETAYQLGMSFRRVVGKISISVVKDAIERSKGKEDPEQEAFSIVKAHLEEFKPSPKPKSWREEDMQKALNLVSRGAPMAPIARRYRIPQETLRLRTRRKEFCFISDELKPSKKSQSWSRMLASLTSDATDLPQAMNNSQESIPLTENQVIPEDVGQVSSTTADADGTLMEVQGTDDLKDTTFEVVLAEEADQDKSSQNKSSHDDDIRMWTEEGMQEAIKMYKDGIPLRCAARKYFIPYQTMRSRLGMRQIKTTGAPPEKAHLKREDELRIRDYVLQMVKANEPVTHDWIRQLAKEVAIARGKPFGPNSPSHSWWSGFKLRHPEVEGLTIPTVREYIKSHVPPVKKQYNTFSDARIMMESLQLIDKPERIYCIDECCLGGIDSKCVKGRVIFPEGEAESSVDHVTITNCVSAEGTWLPPLFTFKESLPETHEYMFNGPANSINMSNDTGRPNKQSYLLYIKHLEQFLCQERPVVIMHPNILRRQPNKELVQFCLDHQIHLISIRRSENNSLQPLDHLYDKYRSTIKGRYNEASMLLNPMALDKGKIPIIIRFAMQAMSDQNLLSEAIRVTGLYPFNSSSMRALSSLCKSSDNSLTENAEAVSSILPGETRPAVLHEDKQTQTEPPVIQLSFKTTNNGDGDASTSGTSTMDVAYLPQGTSNALTKIKLPEVKLPPINLAELVPMPAVFLEEQIAIIQQGSSESRRGMRKPKVESVCGLVDEQYVCLTCGVQAEEIWMCEICNQGYHTSCYQQSHDFSNGVCYKCADSQEKQTDKVCEVGDMTLWPSY